MWTEYVKAMAAMWTFTKCAFQQKPCLRIAFVLLLPKPCDQSMVISSPKIWNKNWFLFAILNDTKWLTIVDFHLEMLLYLHPHVSFFSVHVFVHCFSHTFSLSLEANNASFQATRGAEFHNLPSRYISSLLLAPDIYVCYHTNFPYME